MSAPNPTATPTTVNPRPAPSAIVVLFVFFGLLVSIPTAWVIAYGTLTTSELVGLAAIIPVGLAVIAVVGAAVADRPRTPAPPLTQRSIAPPATSITFTEVTATTFSATHRTSTSSHLDRNQSFGAASPFDAVDVDGFVVGSSLPTGVAGVPIGRLPAEPARRSRLRHSRERPPPLPGPQFRIGPPSSR